MMQGKRPVGSRPRTRVVLAAAAAATLFVALVAGAPAAHAEPTPRTDLFGLELPGPTLDPVGLPPVPLPPVNLPPLPDAGSVLEQVPVLPGPISTITNPATPTAAAFSEVAGVVVAATSDAPATTSANAEALAPLRRGEVRPTGSTAVLRLAQSATAVLVLALAAMAFLVMQSMSERRNPRLVAAPFDRRETELEFQ